MDWITGIQRALDYTEAHLTEEIDYEAVAKQALSSVFHFQRMFGMLCGFSLGDYIRMRRLTLAAEELMRSKRKVIDIALQYGYDTPESFSRAFLRFHGITPTHARRGGTVKSFSRLSVKLMLYLSEIKSVTFYPPHLMRRHAKHARMPFNAISPAALPQKQAMLLFAKQHYQETVPWITGLKKGSISAHLQKEAGHQATGRNRHGGHFSVLGRVHQGRHHRGNLPVWPL